MSIIVLIISVVLVGFVLLVVMFSFDNFSGLILRVKYSVIYVFFEVFLVFGIFGLIMGIISLLNVGFKIVLSILMFIG